MGIEMIDKPTPEPKVSLDILVPAYEFPDGVTRILTKAGGSTDCQVNIIIGDDSVTDGVEQAVNLQIEKSSARILYHRNRPGLGAVKNWNSLITQSSAEWLLFMHHDEAPARANFFELLSAEIQDSLDFDVIVLDAQLPLIGAVWRAHLPVWFKRCLFRRWPRHLYRHNTWGSPSAVVVRRSLVRPFDTNLKWLVDVHWYAELLESVTVDRVRFSSIPIHSIPRAAGSITASLASQISSLLVQESDYLRAKGDRNNACRWIDLNASEPPSVLSKIERVVWRIIRVALIPFSLRYWSDLR